MLRQPGLNSSLLRDSTDSKENAARTVGAAARRRREEVNLSCIVDNSELFVKLGMDASSGKLSFK